MKECDSALVLQHVRRLLKGGSSRREIIQLFVLLRSHFPHCFSYLSVLKFTLLLFSFLILRHVAADLLALLLRNREVTGSDLGPETG
jgi:hypothetical protein